MDRAFYEQFVVDRATALLARLLRWTSRSESTSADMRERFSASATHTLSRSDPNMELHKHTRSLQKLAIHGQELIEAVLTPDQVDELNKR